MRFGDVDVVYSILPPEMWAPFRFWASRPSLPAAWQALLLTKAKDVESNPVPTTHTNKHISVIWICDLCHKQINKQHTSIRCNHTHNTHWVHLNCTKIKQRQYKPDWRCTIQTPTQIVTTLWYGPRIASLPLPRYVVRGD